MFRPPRVYLSAVNLEASAALTTDWLDGQGWRQAAELGAALVLSAAIGVEREIRQKNAGLRTHTLVGLGAALFMLISKYGFNDVLRTGLVVVDPSRVAAQIVSGIGFIGAGLIFVRRDSVRGLTTAASIWVTAAVGAAAGAGLLLLAAEATVIYLVVVATAFTALARRLPRSSAAAHSLRVRYPDGRGVLRRVLQAVTTRGFVIEELSTEPVGYRVLREGDEIVLREADETGGPPVVEVRLRVHGRQPVSELAAALSEVEDVTSVRVGDDPDDAE
jgi:putative Mg2+ transporter-C (MgtC) family protein